MTEKNTLYSPPTLQALAAYASVAAVLFMAGMVIPMYNDISTLKKDIRELREENEHLRALSLGYERPARVAERRPVPSNPSPTAQTPGEYVRPQPQPSGRQEVQPPVAPVAVVKTPATTAENPKPAESEPEKTVAVKPAEKPVAKAPEPEPSPKPAEKPEAAAKPAPEKQPAVVTPKPADEEPAGIARLPPMPKLPEPEKAEPTASEKTTELTGRLSGQVLGTNPDQRLVIISIGSSRGVQPGKRFNIYRQDAWVGDVRVVKVFSEMSTCDIITPTPRGIRKGDIAKEAVKEE